MNCGGGGMMTKWGDSVGRRGIEGHREVGRGWRGECWEIGVHGKRIEKERKVIVSKK